MLVFVAFDFALTPLRWLANNIRPKG